jgi:hypothetical protein
MRGSGSVRVTQHLGEDVARRLAARLGEALETVAFRASSRCSAATTARQSAPSKPSCRPPETGWCQCSQSRDERASQTTLGKRLLGTRTTRLDRAEPTPPLVREGVSRSVRFLRCNGALAERGADASRHGNRVAAPSGFQSVDRALEPQPGRRLARRVGGAAHPTPVVLPGRRRLALRHARAAGAAVDVRQDGSRARLGACSASSCCPACIGMPRASRSTGRLGGGRAAG